jgi:hypothetical protein
MIGNTMIYYCIFVKLTVAANFLLGHNGPSPRLEGPFPDTIRAMLLPPCLLCHVRLRSTGSQYLSRPGRFAPKFSSDRCFLRERCYGKRSIRKKQGNTEKMELRLHKEARSSPRYAKPRALHGGRDARAPLARAKTGERGRLARFVRLAFLRARDNEPCPESPEFVARTDLAGALSFRKTQAPHRWPRHAAQARKRDIAGYGQQFFAGSEGFGASASLPPIK